MSARTPGGYRLYDDHTLDRLAFIARAKQLGCSLEEIAELTTAWEGGRCGPVQDRLRALVADKLATAQSHIVELMTLTAELQRAAAELERHRPEGACDDSCGCVGEPPPADPLFADPLQRSDAVDLIAKRSGGDSSPSIACTLDSQSMEGRLACSSSMLRSVGKA